jgi:hypothetical protein
MTKGFVTFVLALALVTTRAFAVPVSYNRFYALIATSD